MTLEQRITADMKTARIAEDKVSLRGIKAAKAALVSALILKRADGNGAKELSPEEEIKLIQKLVKQRQESLGIYIEQNREDLALIEREEIETLQKYLPEQMSADALEAVIKDIIAKTGAASMKDMGKVMGMASKQLAGKADGKSISAVVKQLLG